MKPAAAYVVSQIPGGEAGAMLEPSMSPRDKSPAEVLNRSCDCDVVDLHGLRRGLEGRLAGEGATTPILQSHPHLFAGSPVFVDRADVQAMQAVIDAVEQVVRTSAYQDSVRSAAPDIARIDRATSGVFMGFDFHVDASGPKLIEINTNAGGAFLNVAARAAHRACCDAIDDVQPAEAQLEHDIVSMFEAEWRLARGDRPLRTIAIVDGNPSGQYLYPEFLLARQLFESRGTRSFIVDPVQLRIEDEALLFGCLHIPAGEVRGGLVICSPILADFGANYQREVNLARHLAADGVAVQRFHPRGTGHSDGDAADLTLQSLIDDATQAFAHLRDRLPGRTIAVLGTRFSALVATRVAGARGGAA